MADVATTPGGQEFYLPPKELVIDEAFAVRLHDPDSEDEAKEVEKLADSLDRDGQIDTILITQDKKIISGHRRTRAAILLNEQRSRNSQPLMKLRVRVNTEGDPEHIAITANTQRKNLSPMDMARLMQRLREKHQWEGFKGAKKVADYLGVSVATVTQTEKLLTVGREIQDKVHAGELSAAVAVEMLGVKVEAQGEVLERAREIQKDKDEKLTDQAKDNRVKKAAAEGVEATTRIQRPALVQAIKEKQASNSDTPKSRKELLETLEEFDAPVYGYEDGAVRVWVRYFLDMFATGKGTVGTLRRKFDAMVAKAPKGSKKPLAEAVEVPKKKAVVKKAKARKAKLKKTKKTGPAAKTHRTAEAKKRSTTRAETKANKAKTEPAKVQAEA